MIPLPKLIIFDCDGTLVDSEYLNNKTLSDLLTEKGYSKYTVEYTMENFPGKGLQAVMDIVEAEQNATLPDDFRVSYQKRVIKNAEEYITPSDSVVDVIEHYHKRTDICLVSNGERPVVLSFVESLGLASYFPENRIYTPDMVENAKPAPDLLLMAARELGSAPLKTVAIEDSPTGIQAACAAGMEVIAVSEHHPDPEEHAEEARKAGADIVVDKLIHIQDHL